jgi:hypothetical protein
MIVCGRSGLQSHAASSDIISLLFVKRKTDFRSLQWRNEAHLQVQMSMPLPTLLDVLVNITKVKAELATRNFHFQASSFVMEPFAVALHQEQMNPHNDVATSSSGLSNFDTSKMLLNFLPANRHLQSKRQENGR